MRSKMEDVRCKMADVRSKMYSQLEEEGENYLKVAEDV